MNCSTIYLLPAEWEHLKKILLAAQNSPPTKAETPGEQFKAGRTRPRTSRTPKR
jgi:hypothetical protein